EFETFQNPIVERTMHLEFQGADGMRNAFYVIAKTMREVIHWIDAPLSAGVMMLRVTNPIEHRIAQPDIRSGHVDPRAERARAIRKLATFHAREKIEAFGYVAISERAFFSLDPKAIGLRNREVVHIRLALLNQLHRVFVD